MIQVSVSFVLLVGAGLLLASLQRIRAASPGFSEDGVLTTTVNLFAAGYDSTRAKVFAGELLDRVRAIPGVESAALAATPPFSPGAPYASGPIAVDGYAPARDEQPVADFNPVTPGYFGTLGIPLIRGRDFTRADDDTTAPVAIVSETMAATYWPTRDPIGTRLRARDRWMQVVGVVKDIKYESLLESPRPLFYVPMRQARSPVFAMHVKTRSGPATFAPALIGAMHSLDQNLAPYEVISLREQVARSTSTQRIAVTLLGVFSSLALLLAAIGLYGVMSYAVSQSTRELGLRLALGAEPRQVLRLVMACGLALTTLGIAFGVATALGTTRLLGDLLYHVSPRDPLAFASALVLMVVTAAVACVVPAWRAARTDLVRALRV
jgi:predicted permease